VEKHLALVTWFTSNQIVDLATRAEKGGFAGVWITDQRWWRDPYALMGAIAERTNRIALASAVSNVFGRHPVHLAETAATLNELAPGRIIIGLGSGDRPKAIQLRKSWDAPVKTVETAISALRGLLRGDVVSAETSAFGIDRGRLELTDGGRVRIAVAAMGPLMYRTAGRVADIVIISNYAHHAGLDWARHVMKPGLSDRSPELRPLHQQLRIDVCISEDVSAARNVLRKRIGGLLHEGYYREPYLSPVGLGRLARPGSNPSDEDVDALLDAIALAGSPQQVRDRLAAVARGSGLDSICCRLYVAPDQEPIRALELLADAMTAALE